jgi:hypothetical protein
MFREPEMTQANGTSLNNSTALSENSTVDVKMPNRNKRAPAQVAYFLTKRGCGALDDELHYLDQSFDSSIQLTRNGNESDRETCEEEQESRAGQKTRAQDAVDVRAQLDGEVVSDRHRSKF